MNLFARTLLLVVGCGILMSVAGMLWPDRTAHANGNGAAPVMVVNTPLPVTGTVAASQSGQWNVGIDPASNTVLIGNPGANPVLVRDADNPAMQPFSASNNILLTSGHTDDSFQIDPGVPAGKRLVIEYVSAASTLNFTDLKEIIVTTSFGFHYFPAIPEPTRDSGSGDSVISQQTRMYHDSGTPITIDVIRSTGTTGGAIHVSISGYIVNLPAS